MSTTAAFCRSTYIPTRINDAILNLLVPQSHRSKESNPAIDRILSSAKAKAAMMEEITKPAPALEVLEQILAQCPNIMLLPFAQCLLALINRDHFILAEKLMNSIKFGKTGSPEAHWRYLTAYLMLGRLSTGFKHFVKHQQKLGAFPLAFPVIGTFQFGLWRLKEAYHTFTNPQFPLKTSPSMLVARQLLRHIAGHPIPTTELDQLRNLPGINRHIELNLAVLYREAGAPEQALPFFPADSTMLFAQLNRAVTLAQLGDLPSAKTILSKLDLPPGLTEGSKAVLTRKQMQELSKQLVPLRGSHHHTPYFHFIPQLTMARVAFPLLPLREMLVIWHKQNRDVWMEHPEGECIPGQLELPEKTI